MDNQVMIDKSHIRMENDKLEPSIGGSSLPIGEICCYCGITDIEHKVDFIFKDGNYYERTFKYCPLCKIRGNILYSNMGKHLNTP